MIDQKGIFHLHIGGILFVLALIGLWFVYNSYQNNRLATDMSAVLNDYSGLILSAIKNPGDNDKVKTMLSEVNQKLGKYSEREIKEKIDMAASVVAKQPDGENIIEIINGAMKAKYGNAWENTIRPVYLK